MPGVATTLPSRRPELLLRPLGDKGQHVVKDPRTGDYFTLGEQESFLLAQLDGEQTAEAVCQAFAERFGEALPEADLDGFVRLAQGRGFLLAGRLGDVESRGREGEELARGQAPSPASQPVSPPRRQRQSLLYWRVSLFDPDRFCTWLEPRIRFFWTRAFLAISAGCLVLAAALVCANGRELAAYFPRMLTWETAVLAWLCMFVVTMLHELAHGLTCKRYGGEVHEIGFLLMFFLPCFYCNVSDAWLFKERSRRLWVTFAGGYFELFLWALAVFVWRLTLPGSFPNYVAFVVVASCGVRTLFNFNPLIKLDGYYLLSDWLEVPNLRQRALDYFQALVRWGLWGAARPAPPPRRRLLLVYGSICWLYSVAFLALMLWALFQFLGGRWGWLGWGLVAVLSWLSLRILLKGLFAGEVKAMVLKRRKRTVIWLLSLGALGAILTFVKIEDRVSGAFQIRSTVRVEVRAPVAGFVKEVFYDEGDRVSPAAVVVRLEVPELASRLVQKKAEVSEAEARLRALMVGPRPEEIAEQEQRVERAKNWRALAEQDLASLRQALKEELSRLDKAVSARRAERDLAVSHFVRAKTLVASGVISRAEYQQCQGKQEACEAWLAEAEAARQARRARGTLEAEAELARRTKELADAQAILRLLQAGSRPEEIEEQRARLARLQEELRHLQRQDQKQAVTAPCAGLVTTARLKEKLGQRLGEGDLICVVEELASQEIEITLAEDDVERVSLGQEVTLKPRALPFETLTATVHRISPLACKGEAASSVAVYCLVPQTQSVLRGGMSGYARIYTGPRPLGRVVFDRVWRFLRTEFW